MKNLKEVSINDNTVKPQPTNKVTGVQKPKESEYDTKVPNVICPFCGWEGPMFDKKTKRPHQFCPKCKTGDFQPTETDKELQKEGVEVPFNLSDLFESIEVEEGCGKKHMEEESDLPKNDTEKVPAAACKKCGGWTASGGMSQYAGSKKKVQGRTGCQCNGGPKDPGSPLERKK